jgi:hypothetical protein
MLDVRDETFSSPSIVNGSEWYITNHSHDADHVKMSNVAKWGNVLSGSTPASGAAILSFAQGVPALAL